MPASSFVLPSPDTLRPKGGFERAMAMGAHLPGSAGYVCFRKMKRRMAARAHAAFLDTIATLGPGDIAVDLGANVGDITAKLAATGAAVHAFEPDPETFGHLSARFADASNVTLHNAAVGGRDATVTLYRPASWADEDLRRSASKANSVAAMARDRGFAPSGEVPMVDFSRFLNSLPGAVQVVKVDIEGAEWEMIEAVMDRAPDRFQTMFVETHERIDRASLPHVRAMQARFAARTSPYVNLYWT